MFETGQQTDPTKIMMVDIYPRGTSYLQYEGSPYWKGYTIAQGIRLH